MYLLKKYYNFVQYSFEKLIEANGKYRELERWSGKKRRTTIALIEGETERQREIGKEKQEDIE